MSSNHSKGGLKENSGDNRSGLLRKLNTTAGKNTRKKLPKNSIAAALIKLYPEIPKYQSLKTYDDVLDELTCYIERTI